MIAKLSDAKSLCCDRQSTKRLHAYCSNLSKSGTETSPNFDDHALEVLMKYALQPKDILNTVSYLDSIDYGCRYNYDQLHDQMLRFESGHAMSFQWNKHYKRALEEVKQILKPSIPLDVFTINSQTQLEDALPRKDTHSGWTYVQTGFRKKGENLDGAFDKWQVLLQSALDDGSFNFPILCGRRLQVSGAFNHDYTRSYSRTQKTRLVNMIDMFIIITELMFQKPVQSVFGDKNFYAGGKDPGVLSRIIYDRRKKHDYWISIDYSKYDQSIPGWLIGDAFELVKGMFNPYDFKKWESVWQLIVNDFIHKDIVDADGHLIHSHNGVPSGDMFTQIIDTVCNLIIIHTYMNAKHADNIWDCMICGDDNLIFTNQHIDLDDLSSYIQHNFGIQCHPDKCTEGTEFDDPMFLSREWRAGGAWREPHEILAKMLYPERFRPYYSGEISAEMIVYSYILAFPMGMDELIDVDKFMNEVMIERDTIDSALKYQSGYYAYQQMYHQRIL